MAITQKASTSDGSPGGGDFTSSAIDTTGAKLIVVCLSWFSVDLTALTDSLSNTWTPLTIQFDAGGSKSQLFYCLNPTTGAAHTWTVDFVGTSYPVISVKAFNAGTTPVYSSQSGADGALATGTSLQPGSITPPSAGSLLVAGVAAQLGTAFAIDGGFTGVDATNGGGGGAIGGGIAYLVQGAAAAANPTWTWTTASYRSAVMAAFTDPDGSSALTSGAASFTSNTATTINLSATAATGGASPYTYQWYRSTTSGFTPGGGNLLSGATSLTLADSASLVAGTNYFYRLVSTDNAAATITSNQVAGRLLDPALSILWIGDSITVGSFVTTPPPTLAAAELVKLLGRAIVTTNAGVGGSASGAWISGSANLIAAKAAGAAATPPATHAVVMLGTNDSGLVDAATYLSRITSLANDLVAAGITVILNDPPGYKPDVTTGYDAADLVNLTAYSAQLDTLANGTTIKRGATEPLPYFLARTSLLHADGIHFLDAGNIILAEMCAGAIDLAINGGSTTTTYVFSAEG